MFSYLALVWNPQDDDAQHATHELSARLRDSKQTWLAAVDRDGLAVFYQGAREGSSNAYLSSDGSSAVLGRLFTGAAAAPQSFDPREAAALVKTSGRHLIENYWGRYVAFIHDDTCSTTGVTTNGATTGAAHGVSTGTTPAAATWILRDPTNGLPCLSTHHRGVDVYFSRMEDVLALGLGPFTVNWSYIAAHLCAQILEINDSALNEVKRLLGGECIQFQRGQTTRSFYWDPLKVSQHNIIEDPGEAAAALRQTTRECVHAWASGHSNIVHTLSGGLDSAIVLACLKDAPSRPNITCVNYYSPGADTDERAYAQSVANHLGYALLERPRDPLLRLESLLDAPPSAYPVNCRYYLENSAWEAELASERHATALFNGEGGDQVFYQSRADFGAGDYLCRRGLLRGLSPEFLRVALDCARLDRRSLWHVLKDALSQKVLGRRWMISSDLGRFRKLMLEDVVAAVRANPAWVNPLFRQPGPAPSGKRWHAFQLAFPAMDFYDPLGLIRGAERVSPLWSQPLLTLCLRIPVDILTAGGWDRAIARRAFQHDLPRKVVIRRTKGGVDEYSKGILSRNMPFMRDFLLNGALIRERLIDRQKLETVLSNNPTRVGGDVTELFEFVNSEAWVRHWTK